MHVCKSSPGLSVLKHFFFLLFSMPFPGHLFPQNALWYATMYALYYDINFQYAELISKLEKIYSYFNHIFELASPK